jgi:hypothetical protein
MQCNWALVLCPFKQRLATVLFALPLRFPLEELAAGFSFFLVPVRRPAFGGARKNT